MISPAAAAVISVCASAVLASWLVLRHRGFGPQTLGASVIACIVAFALLSVVQHWIAPVAAATNPAVVLLGLVVPFFGFTFWSGGVLVRAFVAGPTGTPR